MPRLTRLFPHPLRLLFATLLLAVTCPAELPKGHFKLQNAVAKGAGAPAAAETLTVDPYIHLEFERGKITSHFAVYLKEGDYPLIMETNAGQFFLAPYRGFEYQVNGELRSLVGGLFVTKEDHRIMVWHATAFRPEEWQEWRDGKRIRKVKPGILHVQNRPWVEPDFVVPTDQVTLN